MPAVQYDLNVDAEDLIRGFEAAGRVIAETQRELAELERAERKAEAAARKLDKANKDAEVNFGKLGTAASAVSGPLGEILMAVDDLGGGLENLESSFGEGAVAIGIAATATAAFTLAVGGAVAGSLAWAEAAGEAGDRLDALGLLTREQSKVADDLQRATAATTTATDALTVKLAAATPSVSELTTAWTGLKVELGESAEAFQHVADESEKSWARILLGPETYKTLIGAGKEFQQHSEAMTEALAEEERRRQSALRGSGQVVQEELKKKEEAEKKADSESKRLDSDREARLRAYAAAMDAGNQQLAEAGRLTKFWADRDAEAAKKAQELLDKSKEFDALIADTARDAEAAGKIIANMFSAADAERQKELLNGIRDAAIQSAQQVTSAITGFFSDRADARIEDAEKDKQDSDDRLARLNEQLRTGKNLSAEEQQAIRDKIRDEQKLQKKIAEERKKAGQAKKTAALSEALINGALAITMCFAQLGPIAGAIAAVGVGATTAFQAASIAKQKFHDGGSLGNGPDEFFMGAGAVARQGEQGFVFTQKAVETGAVQQAEAANREGGPTTRAPGSGEMRLVLADAGRVIGEAVIRERRRPGSPLAVGSSDGVRNPFGRRR